MGSRIHSEFGLACGFSPEPFLQKPIGRFLVDVLKIDCVSDKILKLDDIVCRLQDEMKKIDAFKRELPLCMLLISDAIVAAQEELAECKKKLNPEPVLAEFIPLKKTCTDEKDNKLEGSKENDVSSGDKKNWMSSVQLWNSDDQYSDSNTDYSCKKSFTTIDTSKKVRIGEELNEAVMDDVLESGKKRTLVPLKRSPNFPVMAVQKEAMDELPVAGLSLCTPGVKNSMEVISPIGSSYSRSSSSPATSNLEPSFKPAVQTGRKQRRCWSAELHRQFINALQHLGGPQAATPKQIREYMQVDGLTNDEVKSHLQKYRLHMRRTAANSTTQHVGLWASQEQLGESLKQSNRLSSGSPEGPLHLSRSREGDSLDEDDE